jgi:periodic tryptophan protein 1
LQIWDVGANFGVRKAFAQKLKQSGRELKEREKSSGGVVGVEDDDEGSERGGGDDN